MGWKLALALSFSVLAGCASHGFDHAKTPCHDGWTVNGLGKSTVHHLSDSEQAEIQSLLNNDRNIVCAHDVPPNDLLVINSDGSQKYSTRFRKLDDGYGYVSEEMIISLRH